MVLLLDMSPITMLIEAITLAALLGRGPISEPVVTCHHGTVSYKFVGAPGATFRYMGESYTVPKRGWIELIRDGGDTTYQFASRTLELEVWPINEFGTRTVPLPSVGASALGRAGAAEAAAPTLNPPASTP